MTVAVGLQPTVRRPVSTASRSDAGPRMRPVQASLRDATPLLAEDRGLKPTATVNGRSATGSALAELWVLTRVLWRFERDALD